MTLIGATTENPYFELSGALLSRSKIFELQPLTQMELVKMLTNVLQDKERGYGKLKINIKETELAYISQLSAGDGKCIKYFRDNNFVYS